MPDKADGGPAFPQQMWETENGKESVAEWGCGGMSLRAYFAGENMAQLGKATLECGISEIDVVILALAATSTRMADALIAELAVKEHPVEYAVKCGSCLKTGEPCYHPPLYSRRQEIDRLRAELAKKYPPCPGCGEGYESHADECPYVWDKTGVWRKLGVRVEEDGE